MNETTNRVYVLSGYAKCSTANSVKYKLGNKHSIGLLTTDENYQTNIKQLKEYIKDLGWESIMFCVVEEVDNVNALSHEVLISSYARAQQNGQSLVVNDQPITIH